MFSGIYFDLAHFYFMEVWKDVLGYEGLYQVSDLGRVKSLNREIIKFNGNIRHYPERILKLSINTTGYLYVGLYKKNKIKLYKVHRLVWESFNGNTDLHIDHIVEGNKTDNRLCNLQAIKQRENISKHHLSKNKSSKYTGVSWDKNLNKWRAQIYINGKLKYLGVFVNELDASNAYQNALNKQI
jgi:hypothetical protein